MPYDYIIKLLCTPATQLGVRVRRHSDTMSRMLPDRCKYTCNCGYRRKSYVWLTIFGCHGEVFNLLTNVIHGMVEGHLDGVIVVSDANVFSDIRLCK